MSTYRSRLAKLMAREREAIAHTLERSRQHPGSFSERDIDRLKSLMADVEVVAQLGQSDELAVNNYQALCISSFSVPFIDIDSRDKGTLRSLQTELGNAGLGGRLYRTRKGYRIALAQELKSEELFSRYLPEQHLERYGIDKTYGLFCVELGNYRARVSAKPWRIARKGYDRLSRYERWGKYPVIQFVENFGCMADISDHWRAVMDCHDATSHCTTNRLKVLY